MKKSLKLTMVAFCIMAIGMLSSCGGPSVCECAKKALNPDTTEAELDECEEMIQNMDPEKLAEEMMECE